MADVFQKDDWCLLRATMAVARNMRLHPDTVEDIVQDAIILMMRDARKKPGLRFSRKIIRWRILDALTAHKIKERRERRAKESSQLQHDVRTQPSRGTDANRMSHVGRNRRCRRGHLKEGHNVYVQPKTGIRFCRECQQISQRRLKEKRQHEQ